MAIVVYLNTIVK